MLPIGGAPDEGSSATVQESDVTVRQQFGVICGACGALCGALCGTIGARGRHSLWRILWRMWRSAHHGALGTVEPQQLESTADSHLDTANNP